jgi:sialate O-acetylesterase
MQTNNYRTLQRDRDGFANLQLELPSGSHTSELSVQVVKDKTELPANVQVDEDGRGASVALPTGGPYSVALYSQDHLIREDHGLLVGDIWVLAGQSNMQGLGEKIPDHKPLNLSTMLSFDGNWKPTLEPTHRFWETNQSAQFKMSPFLGFEQPLEELEQMYEELHAQDLVEPVGGVGPGYFFAEELMKLCDVPVGLIPCALGGSSLDMWQKGFALEKDVRVEDTLYGDLIKRAATSEVPIRGILWYQGESDSHDELSKSYFERFERFVSDVREDLRIPDLPFITVQLATSKNMDWAGEENWDRIRETQRLASERIPGVDLVAAADLPRVDEIHISTEGYRILGKRLALAASRFVTGCPSSFVVPRLERVSSTQDGVEVVFADVNGSLAIAEGIELRRSFSITGNSIREALIVSQNSVKLLTERPVAGDQEIFHGRGFTPHIGLIDSAGFLMPMFGPVHLQA